MNSPVRVACDALRSDANKWAQAAEALRTAARSADGLVLGLDKLGMHAQLTGLTSAYDRLRQKITRLLEGGGTGLDELATTLRQAADTYQREDELGAHRIARAGADQ